MSLQRYAFKLKLIVKTDKNILDTHRNRDEQIEFNGMLIDKDLESCLSAITFSLRCVHTVTATATKSLLICSYEVDF